MVTYTFSSSVQEVEAGGALRSKLVWFTKPVLVHLGYRETLSQNKFMSVCSLRALFFKLTYGSSYLFLARNGNLILGENYKNIELHKVFLSC